MNPFTPSRPSRGCARQAGFSLLTAMIFLVVLSLLAVVAMRGVITGTRMATNTQDQNLAFQSAEAALRDAEADIAASGYGDASLFAADCANGLCLPSADGVSVWVKLASADNAWQGAASASATSKTYGAVTSAAALPDPLRQPRYVIEYLGPVGDGGGGGLASGGAGYEVDGSGGKRHAYRVTAVGFGRIENASGAPAARVVLQSLVEN